MAKTISYRDIRVAVSSPEDIKLNPMDTYFRVFYGNDTTPSESCFYNPTERVAIGYDIGEDTFFSSAYNSNGEFVGGSDIRDTNSIPTDIREALTNL